MVVLDGVVTQVVHHLVQHAGDAAHLHRQAHHLQSNSGLLGGGVQPPGHVLGDGEEIYRLPLQTLGPLIQPGEADDVLHQGNEALGLLVDVAGKALDVLGLDHAALHDLRNAGDGGEGGFQLVGDIGGELPPQLVPLFLLGHIQKHQHRAGGFSVGQHRVGQQFAVPAVQMEHLLAALA